MQYPYSVLEVPHQRPPTAWVARSDYDIWRRAGAACPADTVEGALEWIGDDLHDLRRYTPEQTVEVLEGQRALPAHQRALAWDAVRRAARDLFEN